MSIYVVNLSSVVDDNSGNLMVSASNILLPRLASDWNIIAPIIVYKGKNPGNIPVSCLPRCPRTGRPVKGEASD